jgi:LacI family transcriptional regulator
MDAMTDKADAFPGRATLSDVAREARVSLATADRVLNNRSGVHAKSIARVREAVTRLNYRPDPAAARLARTRSHRWCVVFPSGNNPFVAQLQAELAACRAWLEDHRASVQTLEVDVFEPQRLADLLRSLQGQCEAAIVMGLDHPLVQNAIDGLVEGGCEVITLVSDVPRSRRHAYVGIDNAAAGRTAASLLGRFVGREPGEVGVVAGSLSLRDHAERCLGFNQVMTSEFAHLTVLPAVQGKDSPALNEVLVRQLLAEHPRLRAIYSVGAGNAGISAALQAAGRAHDVVFIGHELTPAARADLLDGTLDAVINQDAGHEVRSALRQALARATREPVLADQERIRIDIYLKDNLP